MDITKLSAALPDQITLKKVIYPYANPNRSGDESYMDLVIEDGGILDGTFDGYCIDADRLIDFELDNNGNGVIDQSEIGTSYSAKVYSSYEELPAELVGPNLIEKPENLDLLNWILNQDFVSQTSPGGFGKYTFADVQRAIWTLIDDDTSIVGVGYEGYLWEQERVDEIIAAAQANGEGFVPTFGQKMGVIIVPDTDNNGSPDAQIVIAAVELSKLGDKVFEDSDADGIQDAGEAGIAGVTVNLLGDIDGNGQIESHEVIDTTQTDANGEYSFTVVAGDYKVQFETPDGFDNVSPRDQGNDDAIDSDGLISDVVTLAPGEYDPTLDAGFYKQASLGDRVWLDSDKDGIQDAGEQGLEGVKVTLTGGGADGVIGTADDTTATTTTDANGNYNFDNLNPGEEYKVTFSDLPQGYEFTQQDAGGDDGQDSDANPSNGMTQKVILDPGENNTTLDAGIVAKPASLGDRVWYDTDKDGIQDAGEQGLEGVKVTLTGGGADGVIGTADDTTATTTTDANGNYNFDNLNPGEEYKVTFSDLPQGYEFTQQDAGGDDGQDSDANPSNGMTQKVILDPGENNTTLDAGIVAKPASLGDRVWYDTDKDGIQDAGEQGVEGVKVTLTGGGVDGVIGTADDTTATTTTDANGNYNFDNLNPGEEYKVTFSDLPQGYEFTQQDAGGDDGQDSDANPSNGMTQKVVLDPGENNTTLDAGIVAKPASLGDRVWYDTDKDGIQDAGEQGVEGVKVTLTGGGVDGVIGTADDTIATTTTDANGNYNFDNLNPGEEYKVNFSDLPQGYEFTQQDAGGDDGQDSDANPSNGMTQKVVLDPGENNTTLDAGIVAKPASLGDRVWYDTDKDGIQDAEEQGVEGVKVTLTGGGNDGVIGTADDTTATTTTDANGNYNFDNLNPGEEYKVTFSDLPQGYEFTQQDAGGDDGQDSDANPSNGMTQKVVLDPGENNTTLDAGIVAKPASLGDRVWLDADKDGIQDAGEQGVEGVKVTLTGGGNDGVIGTADDTTATTTTDANGNYNFDNLNPGEEYKVTFELPSNSVNLVQNGSFEQNSIANDQWGIESSLSGWSRTVGSGIEVQKLSHLFGSADDGTAWIELDGAGNTGIRQEINTEVGKTYNLSFAYSGRPGVSAQSNTMEVYWNGQLIDTISESGEGQSKSQWKTYNYQVQGGNGETTGLEFRAAGSSDGLGVFLDDVKLIDSLTNYKFTNQNSGSDDALDSDADPSNGMTQTVILAPGEHNSTLDAGIVAKPASLGDRVWYDNDKDGIQDAGEQGVEGVTVTLTGGGADGVIGNADDTTATTTTDANGNYNFDNLNPGEEYKVTFSDIPEGYQFTQGNAGSNDAIDSDVVPMLSKESIFIANASFEEDNLPYNHSYTVNSITGWNVNSSRAGAWNVHPNSYTAEAPDGNNVAYIDNGGTISQILAENFAADHSYELKFAVGDEKYAGNSSGWEARLYAGNTLLGSVSNADFDPADDSFVTATLALDAETLQAYSSSYGEKLKIEFYDDGSAANVHFDNVQLTKQFNPDPTTGMTQTVTLAPGEHNSTLDAGIVEPANPGIEIEKFVNGIDVTDINNLPEIAAGENVTFTYKVTNTGNVAFTANQVVVTDDHGTPNDSSDDFTATLNLTSDVGGDGILSAGETWTYTSETFVAENLTTITPAKDLQFSFTGNSYTDGSDGNIRTFTYGNVSVDVSAFRGDKNGSNFDKAYVGAYSGGLGVTNRKESGSGHRVDNSGSIDYLLFEFDKDIVVDKAFLKYVGDDSDISIWIGDRNGTDISHLNSTLLGSFTKENNFTKSSNSRWADFNNDELVGDTVIISAYTGSSNDSFKLNKLDVSVPGEKNTGTYVNIATVTASNVSDSDESGYTNHNPVCAKLVGSSSINEGDKGYYKIQLDGVSDRDRYFDIKVSNESAKLTNDNRAGHQDIMWGGYYDTRNRDGRVIKKTYGYIAQGRAGDTSDDRVAVGPGDAS